MDGTAADFLCIVPCGIMTQDFHALFGILFYSEIGTVDFRHQFLYHRIRNYQDKTADILILVCILSLMNYPAVYK